MTCANILEEIKELLEKLGFYAIRTPSCLWHPLSGSKSTGQSAKKCKVRAGEALTFHPWCRQQSRGQTSGTSVSAPVLKVDLCKKLVAYPRDTEWWHQTTSRIAFFMGLKCQNRFPLTPRAHMTNTISLLDFTWLLISVICTVSNINAQYLMWCLTQSPCNPTNSSPIRSQDERRLFYL